MIENVSLALERIEITIAQIEDRQKMEREREQANLLRAISHDLRTPLTTIYGSSSAILENYETFSDEQKSQMLKVIKEDSQWLVRMVENLLSVTKIDGENLKIIKTPTVLEELLDSVLRKIKSRYPKTIIKLDIPDDFIIVPMDAILIEQVIMNILENAIQHAKGMTEILLKAEISQNKVVFIISDDGCGIPEEKLNNIFIAIFSVTEQSFDYKKRNIGIGLSVCSTIIKAHGGNIYAKNLKKGAEFQFTLDMREEDMANNKY